ncbi:MAG: hypothetical protein ACOYL8_03225 [Patescibacteria group bacterium]
MDAFNTFVIKDHGVFEEMHSLLEEYPNKKIIVTNANDEQLITLGLVNLPYELFTLKHNPEKTNSEYYRLLLNEYHLKSEDVVYFEHNAEAVKSAESIGIKTHKYDHEVKDLSGLKKFIDENIN